VAVPRICWRAGSADLYWTIASVRSVGGAQNGILCRVGLSRSNIRLVVWPAVRLRLWRSAWDHRAVLFILVYVIVRSVLGLLVVLFRRDLSKDAELLVLRHENGVLRR
jgi:hypothetical protein